MKVHELERLIREATADAVNEERARIREFLEDRISDLSDEDQTAEDRVRLDEIEYLFSNDPVLIEGSGETNQDTIAAAREPLRGLL